jgi:small subunit ribosomal protein S12
MSTFNQTIRLKKRPEKKRTVKVPALSKKPQRKASCVKLFTSTPRKPNSSLRKLAKIKYRAVFRASATIKYTFAHIPGEGHNLKEHAVVLFRGGRTQDMPGLKYKLVRGAFDLKGLVNRRNARSKYGTKKPKNK